MKKIIRIIIAICLTAAFTVNISCGAKAPDENDLSSTSEQENTSSFTEETTSSEPETLFSSTEEFEALKNNVDAIAGNYSATAVQAAVIKDGKLYCTYEYGMADKEQQKTVTPDTKFRIASLSKLVTDIIFIALCDEGKVSLDADISEYLGFRVRNPYYPDTVITPAMLMSHTGSIIDTYAFLNSRNSGSSTPIKNLLTTDAFSYAKPGTVYSYSNFSVALIGCIAELVTDTPFEDLAKKYVFSPLGIDAGFTASSLVNRELIATLYGNGGYTVSQQLALSWHPTLGQSHHLVQGNLTISARDYINIAAVLANGGESADGIRLISEDGAKQLLEVRYDNGSFCSCFGLIKQSGVIDGLELCTHTGSNFGMFSAFAIDPETGNGVVVLTSGATGVKDNSTDIYRICLDIIREMFPDTITTDGEIYG